MSVKRNTAGAAGSMMASARRSIRSRQPTVRQVIVPRVRDQPFQLMANPTGCGANRQHPGQGARWRRRRDGRRSMSCCKPCCRSVQTEGAARDAPGPIMSSSSHAAIDGGELAPASAGCVATRGRDTPPGSPPAAPALIGPRDQVPCGMIMIGGNAAFGWHTMARWRPCSVHVQRIVVDKPVDRPL